MFILLSGSTSRPMDKSFSNSQFTLLRLIYILPRSSNFKLKLLNLNNHIKIFLDLPLTYHIADYRSLQQSNLNYNHIDLTTINHYS